MCQPLWTSRRALAATALFASLAIVHTWPLATAPGRLSRLDNADTALNAWIVAWVAHRLTNEPSRLFDANIFHPHRRTLTYSEPLLVPGLLALPLRAAGASPVLTYNLLLLAGFTVSALAMYLLVVHFSGDHLAGALAGSLFAFNTHTLTRLPHLQIAYAGGLPLALLFLDRLLLRGRARDAAGAVGCVALLCVTSGYLAALAALAMAAALVARPTAWLRPGRPRVALLLAGICGAAVVVMVLWPYVMEPGSPPRALEEVEKYSATAPTFLATAARLHFSLWSEPFYRRSQDTLFPGLVASALALIALYPASAAIRDGRRRMLLAIAAAGVLLSFGPATPIYDWLYAWTPPLRSLRNAARFGYLALFSIAALAGYGLAVLTTVGLRPTPRLDRSRGPQRWRQAIGVFAIAAVNLESLVAPIDYVPFNGFSPVYAALARNPGRAVVELPFPEAADVHRNAPYVLASTVHWRPLLNGYSGYVPPDYQALAERLASFPSNEALSALVEFDVTHIVVHLNGYPRHLRPSLLSAIAERRELRLLLDDGEGNRLYRLEGVPGGQ